MLETFAAPECDTSDLQLRELEREFAQINLAVIKLWFVL